MQRYEDPDGHFTIELPAGWQAEPDAESGGVEVWHPDGAGSLHLLAFEGPVAPVADPADELYAFLEEQGVELQEEEVEDIALADAADLALCEYLTEPDEAEPDDEPTYWMMAVATGPGRLLFASYSCPAGEERRERDVVHALLASLRLAPPVADG